MTRLFRRLSTLFRWRQQEQDLRDELTAHVAMDAQERIDAGEPPDIARHAARRDFGNVARIAEDTRAAWGWTGVEQVLQDLRYAFRQLRRSPGFSAVVVATLALGIGGATAVFSVLQAVLLAPLPYEQPGQLVRFYQQEPDKPATRSFLAGPHFAALRDHAASFEVGRGAGQLPRVRPRPRQGRTGAAAPRAAGHERLLPHASIRPVARSGIRPPRRGRHSPRRPRPRGVARALRRRRVGHRLHHSTERRAVRSGGNRAPGLRRSNRRRDGCVDPIRPRQRYRSGEQLAECGGAAAKWRQPRAGPGGAREPEPVDEGTLSNRALERRGPGSAAGGPGGARARPAAVVVRRRRSRAHGRLRERGQPRADTGDRACPRVRDPRGAGLWKPPARSPAARRKPAPRRPRRAGGTRGGRGSESGCSRVLAATACRGSTTSDSTLWCSDLPWRSPSRRPLRSASRRRCVSATFLPSRRFDSNRAAPPPRAVRAALRTGLAATQLALALTLLVGAGVLLASFHRLQQVDLGFRTEGVLTFDLNLPTIRYGAERRAVFQEELAAQASHDPRGDRCGRNLLSSSDGQLSRLEYLHLEWSASRDTGGQERRLQYPAARRERRRLRGARDSGACGPHVRCAGRLRARPPARW